MQFEAEVISEEVLPAIRSIIARELQREYGFTQEEIASRLEVTQPAVSQYLNRSRANQSTVEKLREDPQIDIILSDAVSKAAQDQDFTEEISRAVETLRDKGLLKEKFEEVSRL